MRNLKEKLAEKTDALNSSQYQSAANLNQIEESGNVILINKQNNSDRNIEASMLPSIINIKEYASLLHRFIKEILIQGIDYGNIPRSDKAALFKSGAEKLCSFFGFSARAEVANRYEDWDKGIFHYEVKVTLTYKLTDDIISQGIGSCNSMEKKYKSQDSYSLLNTVLKMAKKRAYIDAVLTATHSSGVFAQDIEDEEEEKSKQSDPLNSGSNIEDKIKPISKNQFNQIYDIISKRKISFDEVKAMMIEKYNVSERKLLNEQQANDFIEYLKLYKCS